MRNRPIAKLIKWFVNREKGKVVDARSEIQRRFAYLDWNDQKKILLAFLSSGKTDRKWAYNELRLFWDACFLAKATDVWETYHEPDMVRTVIECFPKSYLLEHSSELCNDDYYYSFCRRFVDDPQFEIDRSRLSAKWYLMLMRQGKRSVSDETALKLLFEQVHTVACNFPYDSSGIGELCRWTDLKEEEFPTVMEFRDLYAMTSALNEMNNVTVVQLFNQWAGDAYVNFVQSQLYKELKSEKVASRWEENIRKVFIGKKMLYAALPDEYKEEDEQCAIAKYDTFESYVTSYMPFYRTDHQEDVPLRQKTTEQDPPLATPEQIREMIASNPAVAILIEKLGIEIDNDKPQIRN